MTPFEAVTISQSQLLGALNGLWIAGCRPSHIEAGPVQYAMIGAHIDFQGRDRRRIKREVNKAAKRARKGARP